MVLKNLDPQPKMAKDTVEPGPSPLLIAFSDHHVSASVTELDHYRIRGGMAVETDYIVTITPLGEESCFDSFTISKTYSAFRTLSHALKKIVDKHTSANEILPQNVIKTAKYCELVKHLIGSQRTEYLGKVNYMYVKIQAKQRSKLLDDVLEATCNFFPADPSVHPLVSEVATLLETFFLTDHCEADETADLHRGASTSSVGSKNAEKGKKNNPLGFLPTLPPFLGKTKKKSARNNMASMVVPITRKVRRPKATRDQDEEELASVGDDAKFLLDDDRPTTELLPNYARPVPVVRTGGTRIGNLIENNPVVFLGIAGGAITVLHFASEAKITMDVDIALLVIFAAFCLGLHTPRPMVGGFDRPPTMKGTFQADGHRKLMRRSMIVAVPVSGEVQEEAEEPDIILGSPLPVFPVGAKIGSHNNCWSEPDPATFQVRGDKYLQDKKKMASGEFMFPVRGVDLFLTDTCPENVGSNSSVFGGRLREKPTFLINFRLPWGVLIFYFEIPEKFVPFLRACYEDDFDKSTLPELGPMSAADRTVCRFLMKNMAHKNKTLKIVPVVVAGPWVVKSVVGGKPAIVGNKLPINYLYAPAKDDKACYLEADLDIVASSAARGILSVARTYTQDLTIDLGFVIQGNTEDELPEQMLVGCRLHGVDPLNAASMPPMKDDLMINSSLSADDDSVTPTLQAE